MSSKHFNEIGNYLESENCVSVKWLANNLQVTHNSAQKILSDYLSSNKTVHPLFMLSGTSLTGSKLFVLSSEMDLGTNKSQFSQINSTQVYSIQKSDSKELKPHIVSSYNEQFSNILV